MQKKQIMYGVYYYIPTSSSATVYLEGIYDKLDLAKKVLNDIMPNYKPHYRNSVRGNCRIGWINEYEVNQPVNNPTRLSCSQPHTSVYLFDLPDDMSDDL